MRQMLIVIILLILAAASSAQSSAGIPSSWIRIEACGVSIYMPPDMEEPKDILRCGNICGKTYRNDTVTLGFEFFEPPTKTPSNAIPEISVSDILAVIPGIVDYQETNVAIDGESAKLFTFYDSQGVDGGAPYYMANWKFPSIREGTRKGSVTAVSRDAFSRDAAARIVSTIEFIDTQGNQLKPLEILTSGSSSH